MGKKIIVVDDSRTVRVQIGSALEGAGYDVVEAADRNEGVAVIESHADAVMVILVASARFPLMRHGMSPYKIV